MSVLQIIGLVAAMLGAGGISAIVVKWLEKKSDREESEIGRLREDVAQCKESHEECERRFHELSERLRAVEASTPSYLARWVKDQDKVLIWMNDRAYLTMFAPLGWSRSEVLDKRFEDLLGEGAGETMRLLEDLDMRALKAPGVVQSAVLQLHPDLPAMVIVKVAFVAGDGLLRYEGSSFVPSGLSDAGGILRQRLAREEAGRCLFQEGLAEEDDSEKER
jgi:hypothetical protein